MYEVLKGTGFSKKWRHGQRLVVPDWKDRWGKPQRIAWQELKSALGNPEVLAAPVRGAPKKVMANVSSYGLCGVLLQQNKEGKWQPLSFTSRLLKKSERNYAPTERECLAVVHALLKWRHYLHGEHFVAVTFHVSLKWLLSLKDPREKLARYFDFTIEHRSVPELVVPDALSRDAVPEPLCQRCYNLLHWAPVEKINKELEDEHVAAIVSNVIQGAERVQNATNVGIFGGGATSAELRAAQVTEWGDLETYASRQKRLIVDDAGILRSTRREELPIVVPKPLMKDVLRFVHGSRLTGHYKLQRTTAKLVRRYWWKGMAEDVATFVRNCPQCTIAEDQQPDGQVGLEVIHRQRRFQQVAFDVQTITLRTKTGNVKVLAIVDVFTRYVCARPIPDEMAKTIAKVLVRIGFQFSDQWNGCFQMQEQIW